MALDPRLPVLVGVAAVSDHDGAAEAVDLMEAAAREALGGASGLGPAVDEVLVPEGSWRYRDPGRLLASRLCATARTVRADVGVLQQTLVTGAARDIAEGRADVILVCGGEARARAAAATRRGEEAPETAGGEAPPGEVLRPAGEIITGLEIERGLAVPAHQYAVIDNALAAVEGVPADEHRRQLGRLWADFSAVAASNPDAWDRDPRTPGEITTPGPGNRMIAEPYTKLLCSQWNVNQAAALVLCSVEAARRHRVATDSWVFPVSAAESNAMVPLPARRDLHRSPGFALAGRRALELAGTSIDDVDHLDLYSCFPAAVRVQLREIGVPAGRPLTVTGGMTFAGGPLNNYVLQATARLASLLRGRPASTGVVTAVSGMLTKQAVAVWSSEPPAAFRSAEVGDEVLAATATCPVVDEPDGMGRVAGWTVVHEGAVPALAVVLVDLPSGARTVATAPPDAPEVGAPVRVRGGRASR